MARRITCDQAIDLLRKCHAEGLVHNIDIEGCICNCCTDCCPMFIGIHQFKAKTLIASPFVPLIDDGRCTACAACVDACPLGALSLNDVAVVNPDVCVGCSVCIPSCGDEAIKLVRR